MNADRRRQVVQLSARIVVASWVVAVMAAQATAQTNNPLRSGSNAATRDSAVRQAVAQEPAATASRAVSQPATVRRPATRQASYGYDAPRHATPSYVPRHEMVSGMGMGMGMEMDPSVLQEPPPGEFMVEPMPMDGQMMSGDCDAAGADCGSCGGCGSCNACLIPCPTLAFDFFEFFAGANGFTNAPNLGSTGSFGFYYGLNWAAPVPCFPNQPIGMQIGARATATNLSGASFTDASRDQVFITAGLFRRVDWGFQGGVVVDYMHEDWYYNASAVQIRGELSWVYPQCHELGFWFTGSTRAATVENVEFVLGDIDDAEATVEPIDMFAFFYRRRFQNMCGGYGRFYAGFTGKSDGLIGADVKLPLADSWALETGFTYLIPSDGDQRIAHRQEAWNVAVGLVWYPGKRGATENDYFRPLFNVADNGSFMLNRM